MSRIPQTQDNLVDIQLAEAIRLAWQVQFNAVFDISKWTNIIYNFGIEVTIHRVVQVWLIHIASWVRQMIVAQVIPLAGPDNN